MKGFHATRAAALAAANRYHAYLLANDPAYAASVAAGQTLRWSDVYEDGATDRVTGAFTPSGKGFFVHIEERIVPAATDAELERTEERYERRPATP